MWFAIELNILWTDRTLDHGAADAGGGHTVEVDGRRRLIRKSIDVSKINCELLQNYRQEKDHFGADKNKLSRFFIVSSEQTAGAEDLAIIIAFEKMILEGQKKDDH